MFSFILFNQRLELREFPNGVHVIINGDMGETAISFLKGGPKRSDRFIKSPHPGEQTGAVIMIASIIRVRFDYLVHPFLGFFIHT